MKCLDLLLLLTANEILIANCVPHLTQKRHDLHLMQEKNHKENYSQLNKTYNIKKGILSSENDENKYKIAQNISQINAKHNRQKRRILKKRGVNDIQYINLNDIQMAKFKGDKNNDLVENIGHYHDVKQGRNLEVSDKHYEEKSYDQNIFDKPTEAYYQINSRVGYDNKYNKKRSPNMQHKPKMRFINFKGENNNFNVDEASLDNYYTNKQGRNMEEDPTQTSVKTYDKYDEISAPPHFDLNNKVGPVEYEDYDDEDVKQGRNLGDRAEEYNEETSADALNYYQDAPAQSLSKNGYDDQYDVKQGRNLKVSGEEYDEETSTESTDNYQDASAQSQLNNRVGYGAEYDVKQGTDNYHQGRNLRENILKIMKEEISKIDLSDESGSDDVEGRNIESGGSDRSESNLKKGRNIETRGSDESESYDEENEGGNIEKGASYESEYDFKEERNIKRGVPDISESDDEDKEGRNVESGGSDESNSDDEVKKGRNVESGGSEESDSGDTVKEGRNAESGSDESDSGDEDKEGRNVESGGSEESDSGDTDKEGRNAESGKSGESDLDDGGKEGRNIEIGVSDENGFNEEDKEGKNVDESDFSGGDWSYKALNTGDDYGSVGGSYEYRNKDDRNIESDEALDESDSEVGNKEGRNIKSDEESDKGDSEDEAMSRGDDYGGDGANDIGEGGDEEEDGEGGGDEGSDKGDSKKEDNEGRYIESDSSAVMDDNLESIEASDDEEDKEGSGGDWWYKALSKDDDYEGDNGIGEGERGGDGEGSKGGEGGRDEEGSDKEDEEDEKGRNIESDSNVAVDNILKGIEASNSYEDKEGRNVNSNFSASSSAAVDDVLEGINASDSHEDKKSGDDGGSDVDGDGDGPYDNEKYGRNIGEGAVHVISKEADIGVIDIIPEGADVGDGNITPEKPDVGVGAFISEEMDGDDKITPEGGAVGVGDIISEETDGEVGFPTDAEGKDAGLKECHCNDAIKKEPLYPDCFVPEWYRDPMCGSDKQVYTNRFHLICENLQRQKENQALIKYAGVPWTTKCGKRICQ